MTSVLVLVQARFASRTVVDGGAALSFREFNSCFIDRLSPTEHLTHVNLFNIGRLVLSRDWCCQETGVVKRLVLSRDWCCQETGVVKSD